MNLFLINCIAGYSWLPSQFYAVAWYYLVLTLSYPSTQVHKVQYASTIAVLLMCVMKPKSPSVQNEKRKKDQKLKYRRLSAAGTTHKYCYEPIILESLKGIASLSCRFLIFLSWIENRKQGFGTESLLVFCGIYLFFPFHGKDRAMLSDYFSRVLYVPWEVWSL